jgi:hypothetical protein
LRPWRYNQFTAIKAGSQSRIAARDPVEALLFQTVHDEINNRHNNRYANQTWCRHGAGEFHDVVDDRFDKGAGIVAQDQKNQNNRQDNKKSQLDKEPKKPSDLFKEIHYGHPRSLGGEQSSPPKFGLT